MLVLQATNAPKPSDHVMRNATGKGSGSLMDEYSALLSDSILRRRTWVAEQTARVEHESASSTKSDFVVEMNHKLSVPLKTIVDLAGLLGEQEEKHLADAKIVECADLIRAAGSRREVEFIARLPSDHSA